ncbi:hypothetical protein, partial [Gluconobacter kondonii]|uniref:hypothetical protein n=1 Tax=Gluconobacter kondonii TaxID=941463 RepID=UPI001B8C4709
KVVNQIAKTQKLPARHLNQGFFDPSICIPRSCGVALHKSAVGIPVRGEPSQTGLERDNLQGLIRNSPLQCQSSMLRLVTFGANREEFRMSERGEGSAQRLHAA